MSWWRRAPTDDKLDRELQLPSRTARERPHRTWLRSGGGAPASATRHRRRRSGQRGMPRPAEHAVAERRRARRALRSAAVTPHAGFRRRDAHHAGARHRRDDGDVHRDRRRAAEAAALRGAARAGRGVRSDGDVEHRALRSAAAGVPRFPRLPDAEPHARPRRLALGHGHAQRAGRRRPCRGQPACRRACFRCWAFRSRSAAASSRTTTGRAARRWSSSATGSGARSSARRRRRLAEPWCSTRDATPSSASCRPASRSKSALTWTSSRRSDRTRCRSCSGAVRIRLA